MRYWLNVLLALLAALPARAAAEEEPARVVLDQPDGKAVFYMYKGVRYRETRPDGVAAATPGMNLCFSAKLRAAAGSELSLCGDALQELQVTLAPGVALAAAAGDNLWLAGKVARKGETAVFTVTAAVKLEGDLALFEKRFKALAAAEGAAAWDWLQLAWWISACEKQAFGVTPEEFERYRADAGKAYAQALAAQEKTVKAAAADDKALAAAVEEMRARLTEVAGAQLEAEPNWQSSQYRGLLQTFGAEQKQLAAGAALDPKRRDALRGGLYLLLGRMRAHYLEDKTGEAAAYLQGAELDSAGAELAAGLGALGYVNQGGKFVTKAEAVRLKAEAEAKARGEAAQRLAAAAEAAAAERLRAAIRGDDMEKSLTVVDSLLGKGGAAGALDLSAELEKLPEDVARYALWRAAALPAAADAEAVARKALEKCGAAVRQDAIDVLLARLGRDGARAVQRRLAAEPDARVQRHAVLALQRLRGGDGVESLIDLLKDTALSQGTRQLAAQLLEIETGQKLGLDGFAWQQWWKDNRGSFKRPSVE